MRYSFFILLLSLLVFGSCGNLKHLETFNDDAYYDPVRDKPKEQKIMKQVPDSAVIVQNPRPDSSSNNPYYKEPSYNRNDYYDNEYAVRLRRFSGTNIGVGYYDSYYTNSYFYDQNPYHYGVSVYNGYNFYGPGYWNYAYNPGYNWGAWYGVGNNYNWGCNNGFGYYTYPSSYFYGYGPYASGSSWYCGNNFWGDPYYGGYGYSNNWWYYGNPYWTNNYYGGNYYSYNGGGYYNSNDGSIYYGPRHSHGGVNPDISQKVGFSHSKIANENSNAGGNNPVSSQTGLTQSNAPDDLKRFDAIPVVQKSDRNDFGTKNGGQNSGFTNNSNDGFKPSQEQGNSNVNNKTQDDKQEPQKGFWGKVFGGDNNQSKDNSYNNSTYGGGNTNSNSQMNTVKQGNNNSYQPSNNGNTGNKGNNNSPNYTPQQNNNNFTSKENHTNTPVPPQNGGGNHTVIKPH